MSNLLLNPISLFLVQWYCGFLTAHIAKHLSKPKQKLKLIKHPAHCQKLHKNWAWVASEARIIILKNFLLMPGSLPIGDSRGGCPCLQRCWLGSLIRLHSHIMHETGWLDSLGQSPRENQCLAGALGWQSWPWWFWDSFVPLRNRKPSKVLKTFSMLRG